VQPIFDAALEAPQEDGSPSTQRGGTLCTLRGNDAKKSALALRRLSLPRGESRGSHRGYCCSCKLAHARIVPV
jgi:hypothetical protein